MAKIKYRPEIDGLRALAVLGVILYHAKLGVPGGYVGVDVFFVISGFLITSILKDELFRTGNISLSRFWQRRVKRLLPALAFCVLVTFIASWFLLLPRHFQTFAQSAVAQALLVSNYYFLYRSGYFEAAADSKPLLHTWSLGIEEQFYLVLPVLFLCFRNRESQITRLLKIGFWLSLALSVALTYNHPEMAFYALPSRAWELLLGCILATLPPLQCPLSKRSALSAIGLLLISGPMLLYGQTTTFPGLAAIPPCLGCFLIIQSNTVSVTPVGRFLAISPLRWTGLASYSLYLWHWPVFAFAGYYGMLENLTSRVIFTLLGCLFGSLSFLIIERGFRRSRMLSTPRLALGFFSLTTVLFLFLGVSVHFTKGIPDRVPPEVLRIAQVESDRSRFYEGPQSQKDGYLVFGATDSKSRIFVWGDSHVVALLPCLDILCQEMGISGLAAVQFDAAPCLDSENPNWNQNVFEYLKEHEFERVFLVARWERYRARPGLEDSIQKTLTQLKSEGVTFTIITQVPELLRSAPEAYALERWKNIPAKATPTYQEYMEQKRKSGLLFAGWESHLEDPTDSFFPSAESNMRVTIDGLPAYRDQNHLSGQGSFILWEFLQEVLRRCIQEDSGGPVDR